MAGRKRTLGHATRTDAVIALREQGLSTAEIASRIGIETKTVSALEASALRSRARAARPFQQQGRAVLFPLDVLAALRRPAEQRGLHPNRLAGLIVEAVVDGNLVDAVLDDAETDYAPLRRGRVDG
jgi:DNA-binding CsgD family transcriptional regulator